MTTEQASSNDPLELAIGAIREMSIPDVPADVLARAQRIPPSPRRRSFRQRALLTAASILIAIVGLIAYLLPQRGSSIAFADVAGAIAQTHTFTANLDLPLPVPQTAAQSHLAIKFSIKGAKMRADSIAFTAIADQETGKLLLLVPMLGKAMTTDLGPDQKKLDIYPMVRDFHTGSEKSLGEKIIDGKRAIGFQLARPADDPNQPADIWTFWTDPQTKLPVQIELLQRDLAAPILMTDLHFDAPLDDSLFDMNVPAGYTVMPPPFSKDPWARRQYSGQVVDETGKPIAGVQVTAATRGSLGAPAVTDANGKFSLDFGSTPTGRIEVGMDAAGTLRSTQTDISDDTPIRLEFRDPNFVYAQLEDLNLLPPQQRTDLHIRLHAGKTIAGKVVDSTGRPLAGALVEAVFGRPNDRDTRFDYRRVVLTDAAGQFQMRGLYSDEAVLQVRKTDSISPPLWGQAKIDLSLRTDPIDITAKPLTLPTDLTVHELFGMKLIDLTDDLRNQLSLLDFEHVLILDPGPRIAQLGIGRPQPGDCIWLVDNAHIKNFHDLVQKLIESCTLQKAAGQLTFRVPLQYTVDRIDDYSNGGGFITLTPDDLKTLKNLTR